MLTDPSWQDLYKHLFQIVRGEGREWKSEFDGLLQSENTEKMDLWGIFFEERDGKSTLTFEVYAYSEGSDFIEIVQIRDSGQFTFEGYTMWHISNKERERMYAECSLSKESETYAALAKVGLAVFRKYWEYE
jgi:hypothetical protein